MKRRGCYLILNIVIWLGVIVILRTLYLREWLRSIIYLVLYLSLLLIICKVGEFNK